MAQEMWILIITVGEKKVITEMEYWSERPQLLDNKNKNDIKKVMDRILIENRTVAQIDKKFLAFFKTPYLILIAKEMSTSN